MRLVVRRLLVAGATMALASPALAQSTGTIVGRVTERTTNRPLAGVQIRVVGTTRGAATNDSGSYRIPGVPAGTVQLAVQRIGYGVASRSVVVSGENTTTADFTMSPAVTTLDAITVTATGQTRTQARERRADGDHRQLGASTRRSSARCPTRSARASPASSCSTAAGETGAGLANPHSRLELHFAVERSAAHHRRHSRGQLVAVVGAGHRWTAPVALQRHQSRGDRRASRSSRGPRPRRSTERPRRTASSRSRPSTAAQARRAGTRSSKAAT